MVDDGPISPQLVDQIEFIARRVQRGAPHSSFHRYVHEGVLPLDWGGDMGRRKLRRTARMMGPPRMSLRSSGLRAWNAIHRGVGRAGDELMQT